MQVLLTTEPSLKCIKDFIFILNLYHAAARFTRGIFSIQILDFFFMLCSVLFHDSQFILRESSGRKMVLNPASTAGKTKGESAAILLEQLNISRSYVYILQITVFKTRS